MARKHITGTTDRFIALIAARKASCPCAAAAFVPARTQITIKSVVVLRVITDHSAPLPCNRRALLRESLSFHRAAQIGEIKGLAKVSGARLGSELGDRAGGTAARDNDFQIRFECPGAPHQFFT